jgi:hypothetical protein
VTTWQAEQNGQHILRFQEGDAIQVIRGLYAGRRGTIEATFPDRERVYLVRMAGECFVHLPEDDLAAADQEV